MIDEAEAAANVLLIDTIKRERDHWRERTRLASARVQELEAENDYLRDALTAYRTEVSGLLARMADASRMTPREVGG